MPSDLLLCLCEHHHKERQVLEQHIFVGVARRLCRLNLRGLRAVDCLEGPAVAATARAVPPTNAEGQCLPVTELTGTPPKQTQFVVDGQRL